MRSALLAVVVLGFAALGRAQTQPLPSRTAQPRVQATTMRFANGVYEMRGAVQFKIGDVTITADEADLVDGPAREVALRGNVKLSIPRPY